MGNWTKSPNEETNGRWPVPTTCDVKDAIWLWLARDRTRLTYQRFRSHGGLEGLLFGKNLWILVATGFPGRLENRPVHLKSPPPPLPPPLPTKKAPFTSPKARASRAAAATGAHSAAGRTSAGSARGCCGGTRPAKRSPRLGCRRRNHGPSAG